MDAESNWLYSADPHQSTNAVCHHGHAVAPCRHTIQCPSCGRYHPAYPHPTYDPAAVVEKSDPVTSGQAFVDHQQSSVKDALVSTEDSSAAVSCVTADLDYYVVEYVMKSQMHRIKDIEQEFGVTIKPVNRVCEEIVTVAFQRYNPVIQSDNEEKARRSFLALYEAVYGQIVQRTVQAKVTPTMTSGHLLSLINSVYKEKVFASATADGVFMLVGPFHYASAVEAYILKHNANQSVRHPHDHDHRKFHQDDEREEFRKESGGVGRAEGESQGSMSVFKVGGRLTVKVYNADITGLALDVIVNAANERLQNYAGVAGAIERTGGDKLRQDCEAVIEEDGPLKV